MNRPTWAEIHLDDLAFNFQSVKSFVGKNIKYMAVVKADAYGHGAVECSKRLEKEGVDWFGVALPEEGVELREAGIRKLILCLGSFWAGQEQLLLNHDLTPTIFRLEIAEKFDQAASDLGVIADIHLKVDTGMNRIGVRWDELNEFAEGLKKFKNLKVDGIMTHFAAADNDKDFTNVQIKRFNDSVKLLQEKGFRPTFKDLANSPASIGFPNSLGNMVRLGGVLYGLGKDVLPKNIEKPDLKGVLSLHSKIAFLKKVPKGETLGYSRTFETTKDSIIATIPIGYQDGYMRQLSNQSKVIVNGVFAKVVGRISMDWTLVDVTNIPNVNVGNEVVLIGNQSGLQVLTEDLAGLAETISYEVTCGIHRRVPRVYKG
ncbi:MAG TPA: alanine racemase [Pyrinomonadaceae bacterium]|nr:alanine racemase [Pyrinomonadaceae bacterium]